MTDIFRPNHDPAQAIYDAFQNEAAKRTTRPYAEWVDCERAAVLQAAVRMAGQFGLRVPTIDDVIRAESTALGHVDYGAKWAYRLCELMKEPAHD